MKTGKYFTLVIKIVPPLSFIVQDERFLRFKVLQVYEDCSVD